MDGFGEKLLNGWFISDPWRYLFWVVGGSLFIRAVLARLWSFEAYWKDSTPREEKFLAKCWRRFKGVSKAKFVVEGTPDFWHPFALGLLELAAFPIAVAVGAWPGVAAWFTLKTVAQWDAWKQNRHMFNRFLIGNLLLVILAWFMAHCLVHSRLI
jgi:hypothetical protein